MTIDEFDDQINFFSFFMQYECRHKRFTYLQTYFFATITITFAFFFSFFPLCSGLMNVHTQLGWLTDRVSHHHFHPDPLWQVQILRELP